MDLAPLFTSLGTYQKPVTEAVPTPAQGMQEFQNLYNPKANEILRQNRTSMADTMSMRSVTPQQMQGFIQSGDLAKASLGFDSSTNLTGMTPEVFQQMMGRAQNPMDVMQKTLATGDAMWGGKDARALATHAADQELQMRNQGLQSGIAEGFKGEDRAKTLNAAALRDQNSAVLTGVGLGLTEEQRAETARNNRANYNQRERELVYKQNVDKAFLKAQQAGNGVLPIDKTLTDGIFELAKINSPGYLMKDKASGVLNFDLAKIAENAKNIQHDPKTNTWIVPTQLKNAVDSTLLMSTQGKKLGSNIDSSFAPKVVGGYDTLGMGQLGLYGAIKNPQTGQIIGYTDEPVLYYPGSKPAKKGAGAGSGEVVAYPKYSQE